MRVKISVLLLFSLLFVSMAYALDCQYQVNESYKEESKMYFINDDLVPAIPEPYVSMIGNRSWKEWIGTTITDVFTIKNNLEYPLELTVTYIDGGTQKTVDFNLDPLGSHEVRDYHDQSFTGLEWNTIRIKYHNLWVYTENVTKYREACKKCNGDMCLNDGDKCTKDVQCGSGICNIAGFCDTKKIVNCNEWIPNTKNCNNKTCLVPGSKILGNAYECDWEIGPCPSGTLNCNNQSCLTPSTRKAGQAYSCVFECESGKGENGVCKKTAGTIFKEWVYWALAILVIVSIYGYFIIKKILKDRIIQIQKRIDELEDEENTVKEIIEAKQSKVNALKIEISEKNNEIIEREREISQIKGSLETLENDRKNAHKDIQKKYQELSKKEEKKLEKIKNEIKITKGKNKKKLETESKRLENYMAEIEESRKTALIKSDDKFKEELSNQEKRYNSEKAKLHKLKESKEDDVKSIKQLNEKIRSENLKHEKLIEDMENLFDKRGMFLLKQNARDWNLTEEDIFINKRGYIQFKKSKYGDGEGLELHRWIYKEKISPISPGMEVHHIDGNKLNNKPWNLIAIYKTEHERVNHMKIKNEDWLYCLNYLLDNNILKEKELHRYIKEHRKEIKK